MVGYKAHEDIALEFGLEYKTKGVFPFSTPHLKGVYREREVHVDDVIKGRTRYRVIYAKHRANIPSTIQIEDRPLLFGRKKGIIFNDPPFDKNFLVKGTEEMLVRQILTPDARKHILTLGAEVEIHGMGVICKWLVAQFDEAEAFWGGEKYVDKLKEKLRGLINLTIDLAEEIERL